MRVLLDSVILIDHFNGINAATDTLREHPDASITVITRAEVLTGFASDAPRAAAQALLSRFPLVDLTASVADHAARLRREHRWKLPDALQAAAALSRGLRLATRNHRDVDPDRFPFVWIPYRLPVSL